MGMTRQLDFVKHADTPLPYPCINKTMRMIFNTLCPMSENFQAYSKTPIPLEVMKQLSMSVNDKHFQRIEIWYDDKKTDPIAVGITEKYYVYDRQYKRMEDSEGHSMLFESEAEAKEYATLIGFVYYGCSTENKEEYLIARWADELRPIEELKGLAIERLLEKYGAELRNEIDEKNQALRQLTDNITLYINGDITESKLKGGKW